MSRLWPDGQPVQVQRSERTGHPISLRWLGRMHQVERVWQHWRVDTDWWTEGGEVSREHYALTTDTGLLLVVYKDLIGELWYVSKLYD